MARSKQAIINGLNDTSGKRLKIIGVQQKIIKKLKEEIDRLTADLKDKDKLLFAYESVAAPVNPLLKTVKTKDRIIQTILRNVKASAVTTQWIESYIEQALKEKP